MLRFFKKRYVRLPVVLLLVLTMALTVTTGWLGSIDTKAADLAQFPESYRPYIQKLMELHPNWQFEAVNTGLDWNYVIDNEMYLTRNLVPSTGHAMSRGWADVKSNGEWAWYQTPTAWKATFDVNGSFDWGANNWVTFDSGQWCQASRAAVSYIMDPRNWINEDYIYMFEKLSYSSSDTVEMVNNAIAGTFMYNTTCPGSDKTYAQVICDAAKKSGVSAIHLAVRIMYEKGTSNDTLGSGVSTKDGTTFYANPWGQDGSQAYYNFFNIRASGNGWQAILNGGGKEAMDEGWTTPYLAIMGGAKKVANGYINIGQDTLYFQKFSVVDPKYYFWKQYQQNVLAPLTEGSSVCRTYRNSGLENKTFTFRIPVYENMPESPCPVPMAPDGNYYNTSNPNCILSALSFKGSDGNLIGYTPTFNSFYTGTGDQSAYYMVVPYSVTGVAVYAEPIAGTSKVYTQSSSDIHNIPLETGDNTIDIVCESQYGTSWTYRAVIYRSPTDTGFEANETQINGSYINGFAIGDSVKTAIGRMKVDTDKGTIKILDSDKKEKPENAVICTGDYVQVCTLDGKVDLEYRIVIYGDVNCDGKADLLDYANIKKYCWNNGNSSLSGISLEAADVYVVSEGIDLLDMAVFKKYMWGSGAISQRR